MKKEVLFFGLFALAVLFSSYAHPYEVGDMVGEGVSRAGEDSTSIGQPVLTKGSSCSSSPTDGMEIHVLGEVIKPGTFWMPPGTRIDKALACAQGLTQGGSLREIALTHEGSAHKTLIDIFSYRQNGDLKENPYLSHQDVVFVPLYENKIRVIGAVKRPGIYEILAKEATIKGAIALAGGLNVVSDPTTPATLIHPQIPSSPHEPVNFEKTDFTLSDIEAGEGRLSNGDIVVLNDAKNRNVQFDFATLPIPGKNEDLPSGFDKVFVTGDVNSPGPYAFHDFYSQTDYVHEAGVTKTSRINKIKLIAHNGTFRSKKEAISPGDILYVPSKTVTLSNALQIWSVTTSTFLTGFSIYNIFQNN